MATTTKSATPAMLDLCCKLRDGFTYYSAYPSSFLRRKIGEPDRPGGYPKYEFGGTVRETTLRGAEARGLIVIHYGPPRVVLTDAGRAAAMLATEGR